jgi:hypothetical protein
MPAVLALFLLGCGADQPPEQREKNFGAGLGETYNAMLDEARQSTEQINAQMQRTDQLVREREE